jgi:hypothetical protein
VKIGSNRNWEETRRFGKYMNAKEKKLSVPASPPAAPLTAGGDSDRPEAPSRRQLIERYGKYAIVAAPLLLFVSKGHGQEIHSTP